MGEFYEDRDWRSHFNRAAMDFLGDIANDIKEDAQRYAPVKTGALRASINSVVSTNGTAKIGSNLKYSLYVEEGHRVVVGDGKGQKHFTGKVIPGVYFLQRALYKKRG